MTPASSLQQLANLAGIVSEYHDIWGKPHFTTDSTRRGLLQAMGIACADQAEIEASMQDWLQRHWQRRLPPVHVTPVAQPVRIRLHTPEAELTSRFNWHLKLEDGEQLGASFQPDQLRHLDSADLNGITWHAFELELPAIDSIGYHQLNVDGCTAALSLIVHPPRCHEPIAIQNDNRVWGLAVQLYGVRSSSNWGMGDFSDLCRLIEWSAASGAALVGINPLHALFPHNPRHASPYSPSSREFLNTLYIDVEAVADYAESAGTRVIVETEDFQARLEALRKMERVDYISVSQLKTSILERLYRHFRKHHLDAGTPRAAEFRAYQATGGVDLARFALYQALQEHLILQDAHHWGWPVWPEDYRDPTSESVAAFANDNQIRIEYFQYLQWLATQQLDQAGALAAKKGMRIGLYQDLAVGVDLGGADTWANRDLFAIGARIGCPPDDFSLLGQDWGLPPWIPERLRERAYTPFIALLRANMRGAGALRLDHVMGLMRLFWAPPGEDARSGAYLNYPLNDLLGILALESQRNRCLIIGEDLGTVPDAVRSALYDMGVLSYRLFYFERHYGAENHGAFKAPHEYPAQALVAGSTHDLPTLTGFWRGADIELRSTLNLYPDEEQRIRHIQARSEDKVRLLQALSNQGLWPDSSASDPSLIADMTPELLQAIQRYLARTPSKLAMLQAEDLLGQTDQANLPGTVEQYPNWQRKLSLDIEAWSTRSEIKLMTESMNTERSVPEIKK